MTTFTSPATETPSRSWRIRRAMIFRRCITARLPRWPSLEAIAQLRRRLDELEAFQVERALQEGWSWARIGAALGRTRQAVHKRYGRFAPGSGRRRRQVFITGEARRVIGLAREEADRFGAATIRPEHLAAGFVVAGYGPPGLTIATARARRGGLRGTARARRGSLRLRATRSSSRCTSASHEVIASCVRSISCARSRSDPEGTSGPPPNLSS
jgi:hypothetical protein